MPVYEYEHTEKVSCPKGQAFELQHSIKDDALTACPECGARIRRLISAPGIATPKTDTELKNLGFTKLVRRDQGVYENVTATGGESRIMEAGKKETLPHLHKKMRDCHASF
jgi:putative FmdB family regulatory protein